MRRTRTEARKVLGAQPGAGAGVVGGKTEVGIARNAGQRSRALHREREQERNKRISGWPPPGAFEAILLLLTTTLGDGAPLGFLFLFFFANGEAGKEFGSVR